MTPVETSVGVVGWPGRIPARGQRRVGPERIGTAGVAFPGRAEVPAYPVGDAPVAAVGEHVLWSDDEVVIGVAGRGSVRIAESEVVGPRQFGTGWAGGGRNGPDRQTADQPKAQTDRIRDGFELTNHSH